MGHKYHYKAFISYSHRDKKHGEWLHKRLERYRFPKGLIGQQTKLGVVPDRLGRIFRDRDELPASDDLTKEVRKALEQSEFMIVLCSPNAASSRWVNREIIDFKRVRGDKYVLPIIIDGEPFASDRGEPEAECFPPALRFKIGSDGMLSTQRAEPIAADIRKFADGEKRAFIKLVAGLVGVGLDEIIERDLRRKHQIVMGVTALSILAVIVMGSLTYEAVIARREAEEQRALADVARSHAEFQRGEAEGLIEFMLTELRDKLKSVGRLDALGAVGERAVGYYGGQILETMPDASVGRSARAFLMLGEVQNSLGNSEEALKMFERAAKATGAALERDPENFDRLFEHIQSVFWVGEIFYLRGEFDKSLPYREVYYDLAERLEKVSSTTANEIVAKEEIGFALSNLGSLYMVGFEAPEQALKYFQKAQKYFEELYSTDIRNTNYLWNVSDGFAWIADASLKMGEVQAAYENRLAENDILNRFLEKNPLNKRIEADSIFARFMVARLRHCILFTDVISDVKQIEKVALKLVAYDESNQIWNEDLLSLQLFLVSQLLEESKEQEASILFDKLSKLILSNNKFNANNSSISKSIEIARSLLQLRFDYTNLTNAANLRKYIKYVRTILDDYKDQLSDRELSRIVQSIVYFSDALVTQNKSSEGYELVEWAIEAADDLGYFEPEFPLMKYRLLTKLDEIDKARKIAQELIRAGYSNKHFIVN